MNPTPPQIPPITINLPPMKQPDIPDLIEKLHSLYGDFALYVLGIMAFVGVLIPVAVGIYLKYQNKVWLEEFNDRIHKETDNRIKEEAEKIEEKFGAQKAEWKKEIDRSINMTRGVSYQVKAELRRLAQLSHKFGFLSQNPTIQNFQVAGIPEK
jgi:hypothetical protein